MKETLNQLARFSLVGCAGFIVDVTVLAICLHKASLGPYMGRAVSFLVAVTTTWYLNRVFTFSSSDREAIQTQWAKFVVANCLGGGINLAVYSLLVFYLLTTLQGAMIAVGIGSIAGLAFNFLVSRRYVFRTR